MQMTRRMVVSSIRDGLLKQDGCSSWENWLEVAWVVGLGIEWLN